MDLDRITDLTALMAPSEGFDDPVNARFINASGVA